MVQRNRISLLLVIGICLSAHHAFGQTFEPGGSYMLNAYVEYMHGNMPLVISVPHGGYEKPDTIPERDGRFAKNQDIYTIEIAYEISKTIYKASGLYPYIVINHLHRTRLDANRNIAEAANGNSDAEGVWITYQSHLDSVAYSINKNYGKGLFIDLHGHRHKIERMELGYLLSADELRLDEELLNSGLLNEYCSIRNLLNTNNKGLSLTELIRGEYSLGAMLCELGQPCMPAMKYEMPNVGEPYFSGGYNIMRHGSSSGGTIDGIQIEVDLQTRSDKRKQKRVAEDVSQALLQFLRIHYFQL
ncbi:MAG: hypothetical protein KAR19_01630 [Bacteroidales bacterium]|nr:hypothetical protein [Bacteroidales bacterium]